MIIRPEDESPSRIYSTMIRAIAPRPIAWVSTVSASGVDNLAPFSYFNGVCSQPAALSISVVNKADGSKKDTAINIESTGEFVVNVVPFRLAESMFKTAAEIDFEESEFELASVESCESVSVAPRGVASSPVRFECDLLQSVAVGQGPLAANLIIGQIKVIVIADDVLDQQGKIDPGQAELVGRMGGMEYCTTNDRFSLKPD